AFGIGPYAAWTHASLRLWDHQRIAAHRVDLRDVVTRKRRIPHLAVRRGRDAIGPDSLWGLPGLDLAGAGIDPAIDSVLAGEPKDAFAVERRCIEVGAGKLLG